MGMYDDLNASGLLGGAAEGFVQGLEKGYDRRYREMEMTAKAESRAHDQKRQAFMDALEARSKGFKVPEGGNMYDTPASGLEYDPEYLRMQEQKANADPFGLKAQQLGNAKQEGTLKGLEIQGKLREQKRKEQSPLGGYSKTENYVGTPEEEKTLRTASAELDAFNGTMNQLKARVQAASPADIANPFSDVSKDIKNDLRDLQLIYKGPAFAQLGVLAGPDMAILDQIVENPGNVSNLLSGKDGVLSRYNQAQDRVRQRFDAKTQALGLVRSGAVNPGLVKAPAKTAAPQAGPKKGDVVDGYIFLGGDPADQKSWKKK